MLATDLRSIMPFGCLHTQVGAPDTSGHLIPEGWAVHSRIKLFKNSRKRENFTYMTA